VIEEIEKLIGKIYREREIKNLKIRKRNTN